MGISEIVKKAARTYPCNSAYTEEFEELIQQVIDAATAEKDEQIKRLTEQAKQTIHASIDGAKGSNEFGSVPEMLAAVTRDEVNEKNAEIERLKERVELQTGRVRDLQKANQRIHKIDSDFSENIKEKDAEIERLRGERNSLQIEIKEMLDGQNEEIARLREFARDIKENWDCDSDAHRYGTSCRACEAEKILKADVVPEQRGQE